MRHLRHLSYVIAPAAVLLATATAFAADADDASETAAARSLAVDGIKLAQIGKCDEAVVKLARAEELHHSAIVLGKLGECLVGVGKLVEGTEALRRMLREPLPDNPTPALSQAYEHASTILESAKPKIASLSISLETNGATQPSVRVDGKLISSALLGADMPADPGQHVISVSASGYFDATQRVAIEAGGRQAISLKLVKDPRQIEAAKAPAAAPESKSAQANVSSARQAEKPKPVAEEGSHVPAYVSWAVGALGIGTGVYFGVKAMSAKAELAKACPNNSCAPSHDQEIKDAKLKGNVATIAVGVGGLGVVLGTIFFAAASSGSEDPEKVASFGNDKLRARPMIGLGSIGLSGTF